MIWWIIGIVVYIAGCAVAYGLNGGIRDEMDGIGDTFIVFCWPIVAVALMIVYPTIQLSKFGDKIRKKEGK